MNTEEIINLAEKHVNNSAEMATSARICLADAKKAYERGFPKVARIRALRSLLYSVGVFHADYQTAMTAIVGQEETQMKN